MNNTDVICIDSEFSEECLTLYAKYSVKIPVKDVIYTIRTKQRHSNGEWGIRLNEINNPEIPIASSLLPDVYMEVSWNISRFSDLLGNPLLEKVEIEEIEFETIIKETYDESKNRNK